MVLPGLRTLKSFLGNSNRRSNNGGGKKHKEKGGESRDSNADLTPGGGFPQLRQVHPEHLTVEKMNYSGVDATTTPTAATTLLLTSGATDPNRMAAASHDANKIADLSEWSPSLREKDVSRDSFWSMGSGTHYRPGNGSLGGGSSPSPLPPYHPAGASGLYGGGATVVCNEGARLPDNDDNRMCGGGGGSLHASDDSDAEKRDIVKESLEKRILELEQLLDAERCHVQRERHLVASLQRDKERHQRQINVSAYSQETTNQSAEIQDHNFQSLNNVLMERLKYLEAENSSLHQENGQQRMQYETCLDDVANQVVQALLVQKSLQEECGKLKKRVTELEQQNQTLHILFQQQLHKTLDSRLRPTTTSFTSPDSGVSRNFHSLPLPLSQTSPLGDIQHFTYGASPNYSVSCGYINGRSSITKNNASTNVVNSDCSGVSFNHLQQLEYSQPQKTSNFEQRCQIHPRDDDVTSSSSTISYQNGSHQQRPCLASTSWQSCSSRHQEDGQPANGYPLPPGQGVEDHGYFRGSCSDCSRTDCCSSCSCGGGRAGSSCDNSTPPTVEVVPTTAARPSSLLCTQREKRLTTHHGLVMGMTDLLRFSSQRKGPATDWTNGAGVATNGQFHLGSTAAPRVVSCVPIQPGHLGRRAKSYVDSRPSSKSQFRHHDYVNTYHHPLSKEAVGRLPSVALTSHRLSWCELDNGTVVDRERRSLYAEHQLRYRQEATQFSAELGAAPESADETPSKKLQSSIAPAEEVRPRSLHPVLTRSSTVAGVTSGKGSVEFVGDESGVESVESSSPKEGVMSGSLTEDPEDEEETDSKKSASGKDEGYSTMSSDVQGDGDTTAPSRRTSMNGSPEFFTFEMTGSNQSTPESEVIAVSLSATTDVPFCNANNVDGAWKDSERDVKVQGKSNVRASGILLRSASADTTKAVNFGSLTLLSVRAGHVESIKEMFESGDPTKTRSISRSESVTKPLPVDAVDHHHTTSEQPRLSPPRIVVGDDEDVFYVPLYCDVELPDHATLAMGSRDTDVDDRMRWGDTGSLCRSKSDDCLCRSQRSQAAELARRFDSRSVDGVSVGGRGPPAWQRSSWNLSDYPSLDEDAMGLHRSKACLSLAEDNEHLMSSPFEAALLGWHHSRFSPASLNSLHSLCSGSGEASFLHEALTSSALAKLPPISPEGSCATSSDCDEDSSGNDDAWFMVDRGDSGKRYLSTGGQGRLSYNDEEICNWSLNFSSSEDICLSQPREDLASWDQQSAPAARRRLPPATTAPAYTGMRLQATSGSLPSIQEVEDDDCVDSYQPATTSEGDAVGQGGLGQQHHPTPPPSREGRGLSKEKLHRLKLLRRRKEGACNSWPSAATSSAQCRDCRTDGHLPQFRRGYLRYPSMSESSWGGSSQQCCSSSGSLLSTSSLGDSSSDGRSVPGMSSQSSFLLDADDDDDDHGRRFCDSGDFVVPAVADANAGLATPEEPAASDNPVDTQFTSDFYRLCKVESCRSLDVSCRSLASAVDAAAAVTSRLSVERGDASRQVDLDNAVQGDSKVTDCAEEDVSPVAPDTPVTVHESLTELNHIFGNHHQHHHHLAVTSDSCRDDVTTEDGSPNTPETSSSFDYEGGIRRQCAGEPQDLDSAGTPPGSGKEGCTTSWVHFETDVDLSDPKARANLLDSMVASSSTSSSETENESDTGDEDDYKYQQLHEIHRVRRFKKAADREQCVMRYIPPPRPSILDRKDFYFRYGEKEQEAVASFDFLETMSTSVSSDAGSAETLATKDHQIADPDHHHHHHHFARRSLRRIDIDNARDFTSSSPPTRKASTNKLHHQRSTPPRNQVAAKNCHQSPSPSRGEAPKAGGRVQAANRKCSNGVTDRKQLEVGGRARKSIDAAPVHGDLLMASTDVHRLSGAGVTTAPSSQEGDLADRLSLSDSCAESFSRSSSSSLNLDA